MSEYVLPVLECCRCLHHWIPRTPHKPVVCPGCNSPYWDIPRKELNGHVDQAG